MGLEPLPDLIETQAFPGARGEVFLLASFEVDRPGLGAALFVGDAQARGWRRVPVPFDTRDVAATATGWYALSRGEGLFVSRDRGATWQPVRLPPLSDMAWYDLAVTAGGDLLVCGWDRVVRVAADGAATELARLNRAQARRADELLTGLLPLPGGDLLVLSSPFGLYRWTPGVAELARWDAGFPAAKPGSIGAAQLALAGDRLIAVVGFSLCERTAGAAAWTALSIAGVAGMPRAIAPSPWHPGAWLLVRFDDRLFEIDEPAAQLLWTGAAPPSLAAEVLPIDGAAVVSFYRAEPRAAAVVIRDQGRSAEVVSIAER